MATSDELFEKARLLRALADDIEVCCNAAHTAAQGSTWDCDHATEVRGAITGFRSAAGRAADGIRRHATTVSQQARDTQAEELADARRNPAMSDPKGR
ncbi:MAG TPA: hypothetical protein VHO29_20295 [Marmoricola sp.]|nr:hypothetical protein [Marmoricola sp.]